MIDFHSHILPKVDDGSKSAEESVKMLMLLKRQGIETVLATPHFYANHVTVDKFIERRNASYNSLKPYLTDLPKIVLGAEVKFYEGISRLENLQSLCIGDSKLILLEMPMKKWTEYTVRELIELSSKSEIKVVLAHIERYLHFQDKFLLEELISQGILIQANAEFFINFLTRRKAVTMLKQGHIHFIGSDCHNLTSRPPNMELALSYIKRKAGNHYLSQIESLAQRYI